MEQVSKISKTLNAYKKIQRDQMLSKISKIVNAFKEISFKNKMLSKKFNVIRKSSAFKKFSKRLSAFKNFQKD